MMGWDAAMKPTNVLGTHLNRNKGSQLLNICHSLTLLDLVALQHHVNLTTYTHDLFSACSCTTADTQCSKLVNAGHPYLSLTKASW